MAIKKQSKVAKAISSLSKEESDKIGMEVASIMKNELQFLVYLYTKSCRLLVKDTCGWEQEDLHQYMMECLWKGLATYDYSKKIKKNTYLSVIFKNSMANLIKSCNLDKRKYTRLYCPEVMIETKDDCNEMTGEDWVIYQSTFKSVITNMTEKEKKVMAYHLAYGMSIAEICKKTKMKKITVVKTIKDVRERMEIMRDIVCDQ